MSTNKDSFDWDALMGESNLPSDDFTWTDGSNYLMDGFGHDQTMGEGLNHQTLPGATPGGIKDTTIGMQTVGDIPADFFSGAGGEPEHNWDADPLQVTDDGFNLSAMLAESELPMTAAAKKAASLMDLAWLDPTQKQDPARLPKELLPDRPPLNSSPELEEAWGVNRRTTGIELVPNKDRAAEKYYESIKSPVPSLPGARAASDVFEPAVRRAVRRSHYGHPLKAIAQQLVDELGNDTRLASVMDRIAADHGLAGTVFVNANAFPGIKNGKFVKELKRSARSAAFVITEDQVVAQKLGKVKAKSLDWGKVMAFYRPRLEAAGYKIAGGDFKEALRRAFLLGPEKAGVVAGHKPVDLRPADTISAADAFSQMAAAGPAEVQIVESHERRALDKKRAAVITEVKKWHLAGKVSRKDALRLSVSAAHPADIRLCLAGLLNAMANHVYDATYQNVPKDVHALRAAAVESLESKEAALEAGLKVNFAKRLAKQVTSGLLTAEEAKKILALDKPVSELARVATMVIQTAGENRKIKLTAVEQRDYKGHEYKPAAQKVASMPRMSAFHETVTAHSQKTGVDAREFFAVLKFATGEMNEGMMGSNLTQMLGVKFTPELLTAAGPLLAALRGEHEGLAGTVYVDASAYASKTGAGGCESGALKHRANQIKTVLAMPRCGDCVHASQGNCNIYNKPLILAVDEVVSDKAAVQRKMLHMADAHDAEITASLFTPSEFSLEAATDNIDLTDLGSTEKLGEIMFGGLILEE